SINDLMRVNFGPSVPKHSLILLHWFANTVDIDNDNFIRLTFDPNSGDYGSHHYNNYERILPRGYRYYTIGNLYQETSMQLPAYVVNPPTEYSGRNRDRIIIRVREQNTRNGALRIDEVYITQHYDTYGLQGTLYDPDHTYQITIYLLRQIREFSVGQNQRPLSHLRNHFGQNIEDFQLLHITNTCGNLACLGLLLCIVFQERYSFNLQGYFNQQSNRAENRQSHWDHGEASRKSGSYYTPEPQSNWEGLSCGQLCFAFVCIVIVLLFAIVAFNLPKV
ncbi:uncharacterized protein LOC118323152, partial [Morone saxatilis]|uniref:uncharacterized protein LOC118323152 n=1 Tax=Morone saxatilis TaxID=34816 RepID=UPI0015E205D5